MKAHLMFRNADFAIDQLLPRNANQLIHDLDLEMLISVMASKDKLVDSVSRVALLDGLSRPDEIAFRQDVLNDCLGHSEVVREIYGLAVNAVQDRQKMFWFGSRGTPSRMMSQSPQVIGLYMEYLKRLRAVVDQHSSEFSSEGCETTLFGVLKEELSDDYFRLIDEHLKQLKFKDGTLISAKLKFRQQPVLTTYCAIHGTLNRR